MRKKNLKERVLQIVAGSIAGVGIIELGLAQFHIRMTRLSTEETTGISLFAFVIFGLVTLFAVTRMQDSLGGKIFAVLMNSITALAATWYLRLLFGDEIFFKNLYYIMDRQTRLYELLPLSKRIAASVPLICIIAGTVMYYAAALVILAVMVLPSRETSR